MTRYSSLLEEDKNLEKDKNLGGEAKKRVRLYVVDSDLGLCYVCRVGSLLLVRLLLISLSTSG